MTQPTHVSGTIKPLEWKPGYCDEGPCFKAEDHGQPGRTYIAFDDGDMEFMREEYEARIAAQIQPEAEAQPVASSEAGDLLPFTAEVGAYSNVIGGSVHLIGPDGRFMGQIAYLCQDDALRDKDLQIRMSKIIADALNRRALPAALPAARAEITSLDHPAIDAYWVAKRNTVVTRDINGWRRSVLNGLNAALRTLTEAGE